MHHIFGGSCRNTLVVVPDDNPVAYLEGGHDVVGFLDTARKWSQPTRAEAQYAAEPANQQLKQLANRDEEHRDQQRRRLRDTVVRLSAIDGAVVLSHPDADPCVLQFGAKIVAQQQGSGAVEQFELVEFPCETEDCFGRDSLENLGGTRHQSAAYLTALRPDVTILVVSQDGRASLMAQIENPEVDLR